MPPPTQKTLRLAIGKNLNEYCARMVKLSLPDASGRGPGVGLATGNVNRGYPLGRPPIIN